MDLQERASPATTVLLTGLPALESCEMRFSSGTDHRRTSLFINHLSFYHQRSSLQALTLRGMNSNIFLSRSGSGFGHLPVLRHLIIQHMGLTHHPSPAPTEGTPASPACAA